MVRITVFAVLAVVVLACTPTSASLVNIDADGFDQGIDISNSFAGATLSSVGTSSGLDGKVYAVEDAWSSSGSMVFGNSLAASAEWAENGDQNFALRVDFTQAANLVAIDFIGDSEADSAIVKAYDSQDRLVAAGSAFLLDTGQVSRVQVSRSSYDIAYIVAGGFTLDSQITTVHLDNIEANVVPEPATLALLGIGGLSIIRKRRW